MRPFWYFNVSVWSGEKNVTFWGCPEKVFWLHTAKIRTQIPPKHIQAPTKCMNDTQIPPYTPQTSPRHSQGLSREHDMLTNANRHRQTLPDTTRHWQVLLEYVWVCRLASLVVCLHVMFLGNVWGCLWDVWGCLGDIWVVFMEIGGARMCLGGMLVSQSLQYGAKTLFRHSPERHNFCRLTILRH